MGSTVFPVASSMTTTRKATPLHSVPIDFAAVEDLVRHATARRRKRLARKAAGKATNRATESPDGVLSRSRPAFGRRAAVRAFRRDRPMR